MNTVKIIHMADLHLDSPLMALPAEKASLRRDERRRSFAAAINKAYEEGCRIALLAGDIFESENVSALTLEFLKQSFASVPEMKIFIAPGNHDPGTADSVYRNFDFGENVHIFSEKAESILLPEYNVCIYGQAMAARFEERHLLGQIVADDDEKINIAVIHGMIGAENEYHPISLSDIENSRMDYIALGHIHAEHTLHKVGKTSYAYSGIHEGRHFDETGMCGYLIGEVGKNYTDLRFETTAIRETAVVEIDISDCTTYDDIERKATLVKENIYKIVLVGNTDGVFDFNVLQNRLSECCFYCKISDHTAKKAVKDGGVLRDGFISLFEGKDDTVSQLALKYGLDALSGGEVDVF